MAIQTYYQLTVTPLRWIGSKRMGQPKQFAGWLRDDCKNKFEKIIFPTWKKPKRRVSLCSSQGQLQSQRSN